MLQLDYYTWEHGVFDSGFIIELCPGLVNLFCVNQ